MNKKILIQDPETQTRINYSLNHETWPLENYLMIVYDSGKFNDDVKIFAASNRFYLADHDFTSENAVTFIRHETVIINIANSTVSDFDDIPNLDQKSIGTCCKNNSKSLKDIDFRFNHEFFDNIEEIECKTLSKEVFMEKFVLTKTPVKLKRCFHEKNVQIEEILPEGVDGGTTWTNTFGNEKFSSKDIKNIILNNTTTDPPPMIKARLKSNQPSILDTLTLFPEMDTNYQGMYENRVKNDRNFFEIPALLLADEEIQQKTERENSKYIRYFKFSLL